jgi:hypothetical protein
MNEKTVLLIVLNLSKDTVSFGATLQKKIHESN